MCHDCVEELCDLTSMNFLFVVFEISSRISSVFGLKMFVYQTRVPFNWISPSCTTKIHVKRYLNSIGGVESVADVVD